MQALYQQERSDCKTCKLPVTKQLHHRSQRPAGPAFIEAQKAAVREQLKADREEYREERAEFREALKEAEQNLREQQRKLREELKEQTQVDRGRERD